MASAQVFFRISKNPGQSLYTCSNSATAPPTVKHLKSSGTPCNGSREGYVKISTPPGASIAARLEAAWWGCRMYSKT
jgi:hypothetical protein